MAGECSTQKKGMYPGSRSTIGEETTGRRGGVARDEASSSRHTVRRGLVLEGLAATKRSMDCSQRAI